jgi:hypothetical protein
MGVQILVVNNFTVGKLGKCAVRKLFLFSICLCILANPEQINSIKEKKQKVCACSFIPFFLSILFNIFLALLNNEPNLWMGHILAKLENIRKMATG